MLILNFNYLNKYSQYKTTSEQKNKLWQKVILTPLWV